MNHIGLHRVEEGLYGAERPSRLPGWAGYFATHSSVDRLKRAVSLTLPAMGITRNAVPANVADSTERPLPAASTPRVVAPKPAEEVHVHGESQPA